MTSRIDYDTGLYNYSEKAKVGKKWTTRSTTFPLESFPGKLLVFVTALAGEGHTRYAWDVLQKADIDHLMRVAISHELAECAWWHSEDMA